MTTRLDSKPLKRLVNDEPCQSALANLFDSRQMVLDEEENRLHTPFLKRYVGNMQQRTKAVRQRISRTRGSADRRPATDMRLPKLFEALRRLEQEFEQVVSLVGSKEEYMNTKFPPTTDGGDTEPSSRSIGSRPKHKGEFRLRSSRQLRGDNREPGSDQFKPTG